MDIATTFVELLRKIEEQQKEQEEKAGYYDPIPVEGTVK